MPYYAVKSGWTSGVYETWPDCQEQVKGYSKAQYKKFSSREQALEFVHGQSSNTNSSSSIPSAYAPACYFDDPSSSNNSAATSSSSNQTSSKTSGSGTYYYAVRNGRKPGIFHNWLECEAQVKGFPNPKYKKFADEADAREFVQGAPNSINQPGVFKVETNQNNCVNTKPSTSSGGGQTQGTKRKFNTNKPLAEQPAKRHRLDTSVPNFTGAKFPDSTGTHVYTDGGCFNNGRNGAMAGIGVYWSQKDSDNVSERLSGRQTNNRAEIHAAIRAIEKAKSKDINNLILHTDSQFMINGITKWIKGWKRNGWILTSGNPVVNREDFEELEEGLKGINVKWMYVKGHSGDPGNDAVDLLAKKGASKSL